MNSKEAPKRQRCEVYSRVMWYYRPVDYYNEWKKSEFYSRKNYKIKKEDLE